MNTPKFAARVENTKASPSNPTRIGMFVRVVSRTGRSMNAGTWWEMTDGHGLFWMVRPENCLPVIDVIRLDVEAI